MRKIELTVSAHTSLFDLADALAAQGFRLRWDVAQRSVVAELVVELVP